MFPDYFLLPNGINTLAKLQIEEFATNFPGEKILFPSGDRHAV